MTRSLRPVLVLVVVLALVSCTPSGPVTSGGKIVDDATLVRAIQTMHAVETTAVVIGSALILGHQTACPKPEPTPRTPTCQKATELLTVYATRISPALLTALQSAKAVVSKANDTPGQTTQETVEQAMTAVTTALTIATNWAQQSGVAAP